ncbi:MAG: thiamine ABC transporter substrate-binding protein [Acidimicrobiia bacterium]|nr:thiamine ABC transporter substrate-binding protein [Acidimicrobiia bacterium]
MRHLIALLAALALVATACGDDAAEGPVRLLTHDSFAVSDEVRQAFTDETGIELEIIPSGDAGSMVNQAILTAGNPIGDVLFGVDTTFLSRALEADLFEPYESDRLDVLRPGLGLDPEHRVTPIDFGDVCINYDKAAFVNGEAPTSLADLVTPAFDGALVVQDPATSSPGLAFLLATIQVFGEDGWQDFWRGLVANDVAITAGWEDAYYGDFTVGGGGNRPIVVSYASSPPAEVIFADPRPDEAPTAVLTDGCFRQVEYAGILAGTDREPAARMLIDFLLSETFQEDVPLNMFVFPARADADLPPEFVEHTVIPEAPVTMDPARIEANRERWIAEWQDIVEE